jgi:hypothetical protein
MAVRVTHIMDHGTEGAMITPVKNIGTLKGCGCWIIELHDGLGNAYVPCGAHQSEVRKAVSKKVVLEDTPRSGL